MTDLSRLVLSERDTLVFAEAMKRTEPNEALRRAAARHKHGILDRIIIDHIKNPPR